MCYFLSSPSIREHHLGSLLLNLPADFYPGFIDRFCGRKFMRLDYDSISFGHGDNLEKLEFSRIQSWKMSGNHLNLLLTDSSLVEIAVPRKFKFFLANFEQLFNEFLNHQKMLESLVAREGSERFSDFAECFNYTGGPFVRAAEALLSIAKLERLSDVHFEPDKEQVRITFRQAGRVICAGYLSPDKFNRLLARMKYLAGCRSHVFDQAQEGAFHDEKTSLDVRFSSFPTNYGERLALRFIQPIHFSSLDKLGWSSPVVEEWRRLLRAKSGLFVISGAVGSGKTTALYASLAELACSDRQLRAVTIEDPVEARIPGICQSSLETMRGLDLAAAFKHLLRQDPDIIALGEIRDRECLREALQAGLSGHRVLATFHAGRGGETMARFSRIGLEDSMISQGLRGIIHLELDHSTGQAQASAEIVFDSESQEIKI